MMYRVVLIESDEGFSVSCPALKGCHSQGNTREEALENVRDAIREWLASADDEKSTFSVTEEEAGVVSLTEDPLAYQSRVRGEWQ